MKNFIRAIVLISMLSFFSIHQLIAQKDTTVRIMTTNIRYANPNDGVNIWDNRKDWLCDNIKFMDIDMLGGQEVIYTQLQDMIQRLSDYAYVGVGRNGEDKGEFCPIFYKKDKYKLLDSDTFWLSETPDKVNSKGWDAALPRIVTWVKLKDVKTKQEFFFFNAHFDHKGKEARLKSAELLMQQTKRIAGKVPFFVTGDFNFAPSVKAYVILTKQNSDNYVLEDSHTTAELVYGPKYTFNGFDLEPNPNRERIDYIFSHGKIKILKHHIVDGQRGKLFVSDHFPIVVDSRID